MADKKLKAVIRALNKVSKIMEDRDRHNALRDHLIRTDIKFVIETFLEGKTIPRHTADLIVALTKLYDEGYTNASLDLEKFK